MTGGERLEARRVVARTAALLRAHPLLFAALGLLLWVLPGLVADALATFGAFWPMFALTGLLQGAVTRAALTALDGNRATLGDALRRAGRMFLPLIGLTLTLLITVGLAFTLFVPGLILTTMWIVAVPVLVEERVGVFAALGRSFALTRGSRWRVLWLLVGFGLAYLAVTAALLAAGRLVGIATVTRTANGFATGLPDFGVVGAAALVILIVMIAAIYDELRTIRAGRSVSGLAEIFA